MFPYFRTQSRFYFILKNLMRLTLLIWSVEAFVAALYVDKGLRYVELFCRVCLFPRLEVKTVLSFYLFLYKFHFGSSSSKKHWSSSALSSPVKNSANIPNEFVICLATSTKTVGSGTCPKTEFQKKRFLFHTLHDTYKSVNGNLFFFVFHRLNKLMSWIESISIFLHKKFQ